MWESRKCFTSALSLTRTKQVPGKLAEKHPSDENRDKILGIECFVFCGGKKILHLIALLVTLIVHFHAFFVDKNTSLRCTRHFHELCLNAFNKATSEIKVLKTF